MTSTTTGLPDRYRPLDRSAPDEPTSTGVIRSWRARDKVLNRDVAVRVHTPGGPAAREWITRALTAGGLATPALAMVYDAAESGSGVDGGAAYVVNEWLEGVTLAERLRSGPLSERDSRNLVRRLAEGVGEAHRVGLAVGGLTPEHVVLRPGGLVGLLAVPAATGTVPGDIAALGSLLEGCLTGRWPGPAAGTPSPDISQPDLAALVRRARTSDPGAGLSSVAAMVSLLGERRSTGHTQPLAPVDDGAADSGWLRRLRDRRDMADAERRADADARADAEARAEEDARAQADRRAAAAGPATAAALPPVPAADPDALLPWGPADEDLAPDDAHDAYEDDRPARTVRRRVAVVGLPLMALAVVIALAWWVGTNVLTVAQLEDTGTTVPAPPPAASSSAAPESAPIAPLAFTGAAIFNPGGDGESENDDDVPLTVDGDPATSWSTVTYRRSAAFGGLKDGVGVVYDLGTEQALSGVTVTTQQPGSTIEVRVGGGTAGDLDSFPVAASGQLTGTDTLTFPEPTTTRYVLVWVTSLVPDEDGFSGSLAEVVPVAAG